MSDEQKNLVVSQEEDSKNKVSGELEVEEESKDDIEPEEKIAKIITPEEKKRMRGVVLKWIGDKGTEPTDKQKNALSVADKPSNVEKIKIASPREQEELVKKALKVEVSSKVKVPAVEQKINKAPIKISSEAPPVELPKSELPSELLKPYKNILLPSPKNIFGLLLGSRSKVLPTSNGMVKKTYVGAWIIFVLSFILPAIAVYGFKSSNSFVTQLLTYAPVPYGFVDYHPIWYGDVIKESKALGLFYSQQEATSGVLPNEEQIKTIVEDAIVRRVLAQDLASRRGIWITEKEVDIAYQQVVDGAGSEETVKQTLKQLWSWSPNDYRVKVLRPYLIKRSLLESLKNDPVTSRTYARSDDIRLVDTYIDRVKESAWIKLFN